MGGTLSWGKGLPSAHAWGAWAHISWLGVPRLTHVSPKEGVLGHVLGSGGDKLVRGLSSAQVFREQSPPPNTQGPTGV